MTSNTGLRCLRVSSATCFEMRVAVDGVDDEVVVVVAADEDTNVGFCVVLVALLAIFFQYIFIYYTI